MPAVLENVVKNSVSPDLWPTQEQYLAVSVDAPIRANLEALRSRLEEQSRQAVEAGDSALDERALQFVLDAAEAVWLQQAVSQPGSLLKDAVVAGFVDDDGGAYLVVDCVATGKRLSLQTGPDGVSANVAKTGPVRDKNETVTIEAPSHIIRPLGWLTKPERAG